MMEMHRVTTRKLYDSALSEVERYKYLESEREGHDIGAEAARLWHGRYWRPYVRHRWVEHLRGEVCYEEFPREMFGQLRELIPECPKLVDEVLDIFCSQDGEGENLNIVVWARQTGRDTRMVERILTVLCINMLRCNHACERLTDESH